MLSTSNGRKCSLLGECHLIYRFRDSFLLPIYRSTFNLKNKTWNSQRNSFIDYILWSPWTSSHWAKYVLGIQWWNWVITVLPAESSVWWDRARSWSLYSAEEAIIIPRKCLEDMLSLNSIHQHSFLKNWASRIAALCLVGKSELEL